MNNETLLSEYAKALEQEAQAKEHRERLELEIFQCIEASGGTMLPDTRYRCEVQHTYTYDQQALRPLLEIFNEVDLNGCFEPEHPIVEIVPDKWHTTKVLALARRYGDKAQAIVDKARIPKGRRLIFERREK